MTFTRSEKRREIAARLRIASILCKPRYYISPLSKISPEQNAFDVLERDVFERILACVGYEYGNIFDYLADLIEPPEITEDTSDGYHTFGQLYYQRMMLFAVLVQEHKDRAWKIWNHEDGDPCFGGGWFLVTIDTPRGAYGYHFEEKYWNLFDCPELPKAKHWDGYTEYDVNRLFSLLGYEVSADDAS